MIRGTKCTQLTFISKFLHIKRLMGVRKGDSMSFSFFIRDVLCEDHKLLSSYNETKKMLKD